MPSFHIEEGSAHVGIKNLAKRGLEPVCVFDELGASGGFVVESDDDIVDVAAG